MSTPVTQYVEERIDLLTKDLAAKRRSTNWSSNLSLIVGFLAIFLLCGYFGYGYSMFDDVTQPETVVNAAKSYLEKYAVEARKTAAIEVKKSAPVWAQEASRELIANMPAIRKNAEASFTQYFNEELNQSHDLAQIEFARVVRDNRSDFSEAINIIIKDGKSEAFVDKVLPIIEKNYARDMKASVADVLGGLRTINAQLDRLSEGEDLNLIEQQQKHILGLTRLLRENGFGSSQ